MERSRYEPAAYAALLLGSALLPSVRDYFPQFSDAILLAAVFLAPVGGAVAFPLWLLLGRTTVLFRDPFLRWMSATVTISATVASATWALSLHPGESPPYIAVWSSIGAVIVSIGFIPLWAVWRAIRFLSAREFAAAATLQAAVPVAAIALFFVGQPIGDLVATSVYGPSLQARSARDESSFAMTETYDDVLGAGAYIVLDKKDSDLSLVERRFDELSQNCAVRVRRIGAYYYLVGGVSEPC